MTNIADNYADYKCCDPNILNAADSMPHLRGTHYYCYWKHVKTTHSH